MLSTAKSATNRTGATEIIHFDMLRCSADVVNGYYRFNKKSLGGQSQRQADRERGVISVRAERRMSVHD